MIYRCILPAWAQEEFPDRKKVYEGEFTDERIKQLNAQFYNIYFLPNYPSHYEPGTTVDGSQVDTFQYVFVDMDLKDGKYANKQEFISYIHQFPELKPTFIVDSGNGVHAYWEVSDLDAMSFLRLQRRLMRKFNTDEAIGQIYQLMRVPGTVNTKHKDAFKNCDYVESTDTVYTCEQLSKALPMISQEDENYCQQHYAKTYRLDEIKIEVQDKLPLKFSQLIETNKEVKAIWAGNLDDRSKGDFRLGHIMLASGFSKEEAASVLVNSAKALTRAPVHRLNYALNIIDKIWTYELAEDKEKLTLSSSVKDILQRSGDAIKGTRFPCWKWVDDTEAGFRLGQVIGLVAGSGVGKTALALNMFLGFVESNPDYDHFFVSLEQPEHEIADRWRTMCGSNDRLYEKVHIIGNYDTDGVFRDLSLQTIQEYILKFKAITKKQVGCVVVDHIGVLSNNDRLGQDEGVKKICKQMKSFAVQTNTMLVMQSQTSREKAGIGDLELNKDAAFGTSTFENFCDYLITMWQPLKRCYSEEGCPTVTAFKFCKIRHKKKTKDKIQEDVRYLLYFDPDQERMRQITQTEEKSFVYFNQKCANLRKQDRKTDVVPYVSRQWSDNGTTENNKDSSGTGRTSGLH